MAIGPTFEKGEADEVDLQHAYDKARSIGLALVERYAREVLRSLPEGTFYARGQFWPEGANLGELPEKPMFVAYKDAKALAELLSEWDDPMNLTGEPMRFTADGPVRKEW